MVDIKVVKSLIGGFLIHIVLGTLYIGGNIAVYLASYLRKFDSSIRIEEVIAITPIAMFGVNTT
jgi:hypothetical protein